MRIVSLMYRKKGTCVGLQLAPERVSVDDVVPIIKETMDSVSAPNGTGEAFVPAGTYK